MKIALVFVNYGPYHIARLESTRVTLDQFDWKVVGIEIARDQIEYQWKTNMSELPFQLITLFSDRSYENIPLPVLFWRMFKTLSRVEPDFIAISGYSEPGMIAALLWAKFYGKKTVLMSESKQDDEIRTAWKEWLKQWLISHYDAALVGGPPHKRYLQNLGMNDRAIAFGYDVVENEVFAQEKIKSLPSPIKQPYFLVTCRLVPKKNVSFVLRSYADYCINVGETSWHLIICGDGELHDQITDEITHLGLDAQVHLPGFLQQEQLLPYFSHAQCFILASTQEQWGLVVNEAMAAGLPVLVSNRCGCFEDLVMEGINGFGFDPNNQAQLMNLMLKMSSGTFDLQSMGQASLQHIQKYSPDYFAQGLKQAIDYALTYG